MPTEVRTCAISGRLLCEQHTVSARCGLTVSPDEAFRIPGGWGCTRHYAACGPGGGHGVPKSDLHRCELCAQNVCSQHTRPDLYDSAATVCESHFRECPVCLMAAPFDRDAAMCRWCEHRELLSTTHDAHEDYMRIIRPRLAILLRIAPTVRVSGTDTVRMFRVRGPLGASDYLLRDGRVYVKSTSGTWEPA